MRIAIVDSYYGDFLRTLKLGNGTYQEELDKVLARQFGTADFYSREFRNLGWEAIDIIANYGSLQELWWKENGNRFEISEFSLGQLSIFKPDVVFVQDISALSLRELKLLRRSSLLIAQLSCAFNDMERVQQFHTIFTSFPHYVPKLKALGVNAVYMPLAFHESVLKSEQIDVTSMSTSGYEYIAGKRIEYERDIDVSFVGGIGWQWKQGLEVLEAVAREIPTFQWWGYGIEQLKADSPLRPKYRGTAWGDEMYAIYQRSKIVINRHGEIAENYANNMRMYEAGGCGAVLFTERADNIRELFDGQAITYVDAMDAVRKIQWTLNDEWELGSTFGPSLQKVILKKHTYAHRVPKIAEVLTNAMSHA